MAKLENITVGSTLTGIIGTEPVSVVAIKWFGTTGLEVTYKTSSGKVQNNLLYRDSESSIEIIKQLLPWGFDADGSLLRIVSEAYRIELAHLFDPYLAVHTSAIEPLPHQISAVYEEMLPRQHLRYILADDPGAGKTIMTGLLMKELIVRGDLKRCLIVTPGNLSEQWQDELFRKFNLRFEILTNDRIEAAVTGNIFTEMNFCIARLDKLSRDERLQEKLLASDWDLIVCDEAHKMSASIWAGEIKYTKRFQLGRLLSNITRMFLLLTATPHNGKEEDFQLFMSLIDPDRFEGVARSGQQAVDVSDVMRRLVKEELLKFDGTPLFPERRAYTVNYSLSPSESALYSAVTEYVQSEFNRAEQLKSDRRNTVGFALTILQRRLASSPEAIYQSLRRRRERLERRLSEEKLEKRAIDFDAEYVVVPDDYDEDDFTAEELEETEDKVSDQASAASTILELEAEIETLKRLEAMANAVRISGEDRKWDELSKLLQDDSRMFASDGEREKLIIFTEHRDTLNYLASRIRSTLGRAEAVELIHGGMLRDERRKVEERFKQDPTVRILIATDAAGEGINLQRAHLMINYDLPWNPNRLEQRFGRIHRIGQTEVCHLWNLVANETREGMVFQRLFQKLEHERSALGGKVFDILGKIKFDDKPLRDLLIEAVRYGNDPDVRARLYQVVDHSMNPEAIRKLLEERALTAETMDIHKVLAIREDMERMEAHKLQPHFIEAFFIAAFQCIGGTIHSREKGRYEIKTVPFAIRNRDMQIGFGTPVLKHYERVCFDKDLCNLPGLPIADLLCPGHPLLEATIDLIRERYNNLLKRGAIFVDEHNETTVPRLLFYIEDTIQDGHILPNGNRRVVSKNVHFIELMQDGTARNAGYAPYLDYRAATSEETAVTLIWVGRAIEDDRDLYENRKVIAEGALSSLLDSVLRPFTFDGTVTELFTWILTAHNTQVNESQKLTLGSCDLSATLSATTKDYLSSWQALKTCLLDSLGGYLIVRYDENENPIVDYLSDVPDTSTQRIEFGENLIDLALNRSASDTYTACIPLGAALRDIDPESDSDARLTIESVNDGQDFVIDSALAAEYGVMFAPTGSTTWDEITDANILMNQGRDWLSGAGTRFKQTIKLTAVDLHNADANVESFRFLDKVVVSCGTLCPEETYVLSELTIPLNNPASTGIVLGDSRPSLIGEEIKQNTSVKNRIESIEADYTTHGEIKEIVQAQITQNTSILQSAQQIILTALEDYVRAQDFIALQDTIQTSFSVMAGTIEANFTETASRISTLNGETSQQFESVRSFIRLISSGIVIGKSTSAIKLKLENDVLYFFTGGEDSVTTDSAIAYFSAGKLFVNDVQVLSSLRIGSFTWVPESGNLNFKKIAG